MASKILRYDSEGVLLVAIMLGVQAIALLGVATEPVATMELPSLPDHEASGGTLPGAFIAAIIVVESLAIVAAYRVWKRVPEWIRSAIKTGLGWVWKGVIVLVVGYIVLAGLYLVSLGHWEGLVGPGGMAALYAAYRAPETDLDWLAHNWLAIVFAAIAAMVLGVLLPPPAVVVLLLALLAWDHVAVNLTGWMRELIDASGGWGLPNYLVIPKEWRVDLGGVRAWLSDDGERPDDVAGIIGTGDFVFPSALVVALAVDGGVLALAPLLAAAGIVLALGRLRAVMVRAEAGVPALPWLNTGAIGGYASAVALLWAAANPSEAFDVVALVMVAAVLGAAIGYMTVGPRPP